VNTEVHPNAGDKITANGKSLELPIVVRDNPNTIAVALSYGRGADAD